MTSGGNHIIAGLTRKRSKELIRPHDSDKDGKMRALWKDEFFPFDTQDPVEIKHYIKDQWGPGYYRVYIWGGNPPYEEILESQWLH